MVLVLVASRGPVEYGIDRMVLFLNNLLSVRIQFTILEPWDACASSIKVIRTHLSSNKSFITFSFPKNRFINYYVNNTLIFGGKLKKKKKKKKVYDVELWIMGVHILYVL